MSDRDIPDLSWIEFDKNCKHQNPEVLTQRHRGGELASKQGFWQRLCDLLHRNH